MCVYARVLFECKHQLWGTRLKHCTIGEDFLHHRLPYDCAIKIPHGLKSRKVGGKCPRCEDLERKITDLRVKLDELWDTLHEVCPGYLARDVGGSFSASSRRSLGSRGTFSFLDVMNDIEKL